MPKLFKSLPLVATLFLISYVCADAQPSPAVDGSSTSTTTQPVALDKKELLNQLWIVSKQQQNLKTESDKDWREYTKGHKKRKEEAVKPLQDPKMDPQLKASLQGFLQDLTFSVDRTCELTQEYIDSEKYADEKKPS